MRGHAKTIALFGQSLTKLANIYAVVTLLVIWIIRRAKKKVLSLYQVAWQRSLQIMSILILVISNSIWKIFFPCFIRSNSADVICVLDRAHKQFWAYTRLTCRPSTLKMCHSFNLCRSSLHNRSRKQTILSLYADQARSKCLIRSSSVGVPRIIDRAQKRFWAYIRLACMPSTLKMRNTSTAPNATKIVICY